MASASSYRLLTLVVHNHPVLHDHLELPDNPVGAAVALSDALGTDQVEDAVMNIADTYPTIINDT